MWWVCFGYGPDPRLAGWVSFIGTKWSEASLLKAGYAFEQAAHARQRPKL